MFSNRLLSTNPNLFFRPPTVSVDFRKKGRKYDGLGALSGGGGTSRLLYDYAEPQRSQVLVRFTTAVLFIYIFIEKVDSNHDCCRRECAKETSAPEKGVVRAWCIAHAMCTSELNRALTRSYPPTRSLARPRTLHCTRTPRRGVPKDALFNVNNGGALQIFKTEMGGDAQSTEATEPSHMHTRDDENYDRGYEWWLMKEAKKRNPAIKLYTLSWGAPGWVGNGEFFSDDNILYHLNWLKGAKRVHNLTLDYMGIWNEHSVSGGGYDWVVKLRNAMDAEGFADVQIVASDEGGWPICSPMMANKTLRDAVSVIGSHYPVDGPAAGSTGADCITLNEEYGKPLWTSEGWNLGFVNDWQGVRVLLLLRYCHGVFVCVCVCVCVVVRGCVRVWVRVGVRVWARVGV